MDKKPYNKLIRDKIPEIIAQSNRQMEVTTLTVSEFENALRDKLVEEATEAKDADASQLIKELADIQEVMQALMRLHSITPDMLQREQERRRLERGGFERRLKLIWAE